MEDKRLLLKQIGWTEELIDKCLSFKKITDMKASEAYDARQFFYRAEQDITNLIVNMDVPLITDGTHIQ